MECFYANDNEPYIASLCIVNTSEGLDLVSVFTYENDEETIDISILVSNMKIDEYYCTQSDVSKYYIGFQIYSSKPKDNDYYNIVDFTYNNTDYWFIIDYIEETPKKR